VERLPGPQELIVIAIVALLVFGPERLPEFARTVARTLARVRNEAARNVQELRNASEVAELERELREIRGEFTASRDDLRRRSRDLLGDDRGAGARPRSGPHATGAAGAAGGAVTPRADDQPPPADLEAT
jgi:sec-independent protein translocase protein TatB